MPTAKQLKALEKANASPNAGRNLTNAETALVQQAVAVNPSVSPAALAKSMGRNVKTIQRAIERARGAFMGSAEEFVELHKQGVRKAIEAGPDARGFSEGLRSLQWAIEHMKDGSTRLVENVDGEGASGARIMIGVKVGGEINGDGAK